MDGGDADGEGGVYEISVAGVKAPIVVGDVAPPSNAMETDEKGESGVLQVNAERSGPVRAVRVRFTDSRRVEAKAFFVPFAVLGWKYDFGWLGIYLLVYIAVLFPVRWLLRVP